MDIAFYIGFGVVDHLMHIFLVQSPIGDPSVREHFRARRYVLVYLRLKSFTLYVRNMLDTDFAGIAIQDAHNDGFARSAGSS